MFSSWKIRLPIFLISAMSGHHVMSISVEEIKIGLSNQCLHLRMSKVKITRQESAEVIHDPLSQPHSHVNSECYSSKSLTSKNCF